MARYSIKPETFFVFRQILKVPKKAFGKTDKLMIIRGITVSIFCWLLSPALLSRLNWETALLVMCILATLINFFFLLWNGKKNRESLFIKAFNGLSSVIISIYKMFILLIISAEEVAFGKPPSTLKYFFVDKKALVPIMLFVFEPFLFLVNYKNINLNGQNYLKSKKIWLMVIGASLLSSIIWAVFVYKTNIKTI